LSFIHLSSPLHGYQHYGQRPGSSLGLLPRLNCEDCPRRLRHLGGPPHCVASRQRPLRGPLSFLTGENLSMGKTKRNHSHDLYGTEDRRVRPAGMIRLVSSLVLLLVTFLGVACDLSESIPRRFYQLQGRPGFAIWPEDRPEDGREACKSRTDSESRRTDPDAVLSDSSPQSSLGPRVRSTISTGPTPEVFRRR
jgi:hypothetical protein